GGGGEVGDGEGWGGGGGVARLGEREVAGQGGAAEDAQVKGDDDMPGDSAVNGNAPSGVDFDFVPLAVTEGQAVDVKTLTLGDGQRRRGVHAPAQQNNRFRFHVYPLIHVLTNGRIRNNWLCA